MAVDLPDNVVITKLNELASWCRKNSLWPMPFATACCGIELMATGASRHDVARFGAEVFRFSPRQCDLMIVAGRVVMKMLPVLQRIWLQMPEPKWCISMGACASTGGVFDTYCVVQGIDRFIPVDMYVPGCPPRPEQLIQSIIDLQEKIQREGTMFGREFETPERQGRPAPSCSLAGPINRRSCRMPEPRALDTLKRSFPDLAVSEFRGQTRAVVSPASLYSVLRALEDGFGVRFPGRRDVCRLPFLSRCHGPLWFGLSVGQHPDKRTNYGPVVSQ